MLSDLEKRAAQLAVSRFGADPSQVDRVVRSVLDSHAHGQSVDLLDTLIEENLLTATQAREVRQALDRTQIDANRPDRTPMPGRVRKLVERLGDYRLLRKIGEGGMGAVYLAEHEGDPVAIKILGLEHAGNQAALDRFYREAKSGALLHHPHIVANLAVGQDNSTGVHYLVMEYVDGPSADQLLDERGRLDPSLATRILLDIARGLEHAHSRSIVHRDIKPGNILLTQAGVAKLSDLGLAKRTDEASHLTATRQSFGTPYYMPFEQAMNAKYADARSDIYALGATYYHMLTGDLPFPGVSHLEIVEKKRLGSFVPASQLNPELPRALDGILARMLAREPRDRYQDVGALIVDLENTGLASGTGPRDFPTPSEAPRPAGPLDATSLDLQSLVHTPADGMSAAPWFVRFHDTKGRLCKVRGTLHQIVEKLLSGKLPPDLEVSPHPLGDYRSPRDIEAFREALGLDKLPPPRTEPPTSSGLWHILVGAAAVGLLALGALLAGVV